MKNPCLYILAALLAFSPALAQEGEMPVKTRYDLFSYAVALGARLDAYNAYCEKDSALAGDLVARAQKEALEVPEGHDLGGIQDTVYAKSLEELEARKFDCKDVGFLLEKLDFMKLLKAASLELNGREAEENVETPAPDPL